MTVLCTLWELEDTSGVHENLYFTGLGSSVLYSGVRRCFGTIYYCEQKALNSILDNSSDIQLRHLIVLPS